MQFKTISYQRVLNLGNYESKRLEISLELYDGDDEEVEISRLMELVERKIREDSSKQIEEELQRRKIEIQELRKEKAQIKQFIEEQQEGNKDILFDGDAEVSVNF